MVLVKLQPCKQHSAALRKNHKLGMRFFGPFKILARVGAVAYMLELPAEARIHNVFHVSQLMLFKGTPGEQYLALPLTTTESGPIIMPSKLLQVITLLKGN